MIIHFSLQNFAYLNSYTSVKSRMALISKNTFWISFDLIVDEENNQINRIVTDFKNAIIEEKESPEILMYK